jgi:tetratricopeptide (TPR) repeat protein
MKVIKPTNLFFVTILILIASQYLGANENHEKLKDEKLGKEITDWDARLEYARLLSNMRRYDESLIQLNSLLNTKPDSSIVQIEIAQILYYQGKHKEALQLLEKIPSKDINDKTRLLKADIYLAIKEYLKAETIYYDQLGKFPNDDLTKFKLAELLSWQKRYEESIKLYREILATKPDDMQIRRKYAMVLMWMGEDDEAAQELEKTLPQQDWKNEKNTPQ